MSQGSKLVSVVQTLSLPVFSLATDAAEDCADAQALGGVVVNHVVSIIALCWPTFTALWHRAHGYNISRSEVSEEDQHVDTVYPFVVS